jgi:RIO kinase 1
MIDANLIEGSEPSSDAPEAYEDLFDPLRTDRQARRRRKPRVVPKHEKPRSEILAELGEVTGQDAGFTTTYHPSRHEEGWLLGSLRTFYEEAWIVDVLGRVRGGKEASVYRCQAHSRTELALLAAKVYRPRMFRSLRNDAMYREGREVLAGDGKPVKKTEDRVMRALGKKTAFGLQVAHTSWLMHEYTTMRRLYEAGGALPRPIVASDNAILMEYLGDAHRAAPTLNEVALEPREAEALFEVVLHNVHLLCCARGWCTATSRPTTSCTGRARSPSSTFPR